jgi:hypothetical protein
MNVIYSLKSTPLALSSSLANAAVMYLHSCTICPSSPQYGHFFGLAALFVSAPLVSLAPSFASSSSHLLPHVIQLVASGPFSFSLGWPFCFVLGGFFSELLGGASPSSGRSAACWLSPGT